MRFHLYCTTWDSRMDEIVELPQDILCFCLLWFQACVVIVMSFRGRMNSTGYKVLIPKLMVSYIKDKFERVSLIWVLSVAVVSHSVDFSLKWSKGRVLKVLTAIYIFLAAFYEQFIVFCFDTTVCCLELNAFAYVIRLGCILDELYLSYRSETRKKERKNTGSIERERVVQEELEFEGIYFPCQPLFAWSRYII